VGHEKRIDLGKRSATINNFCINLNGNWPRCTSCHIGYGWEDEKFDFSDMTKIDCLVCHDTTGKYKKAPPAAGFQKRTWIWPPLPRRSVDPAGPPAG
jgi:cytochrome c